MNEKHEPILRSSDDTASPYQVLLLFVASPPPPRFSSISFDFFHSSFRSPFLPIRLACCRAARRDEESKEGEGKRGRDAWKRKNERRGGGGGPRNITAR